MSTHDVVSDEEVAYHEAGHVVACVVLGFKLVKVELLPAGNGRFVGEWWPSKTRQRIEDEIVLTYAGPAAQRIFYGRPVRVAATFSVTICGGRRAGAWDESDGSWILLLAWRATKAEPAATAELCRRLDARAHRLVVASWPAVELVARELVSRRELSGDEVRGLVRQAMPDEGGEA